MVYNRRGPSGLVSYRSPGWGDYTLLDSGDGRKLERFGAFTLIRPESLATWRPALPKEAWDAADAAFETKGQGEGGTWNLRRAAMEPCWQMRYGMLCFCVELTSSRHVGVFPEHAVHWDWISDRIREAGRPVRVLTLFCYTGLASLAAALGGAEVTHVDASRRAVNVGRENQALSGLEERSIRWIVDDALRFVQREGRRGMCYDAIVMDPPKFGRGPKGEVWEFFKSFSALCAACCAVLSERPLFVLLTAYAKRASAPDLSSAIGELMAGWAGSLEVGELETVEQSAGRVIPHSLSVRWLAQRGESDETVRRL
jgi:23S rRNA (cytosine1962-C5)-methyltransferase